MLTSDGVGANQITRISDDLDTRISVGKIDLALKRSSLYTERLHPFVCNQMNTIKSIRSFCSYRTSLQR